MATYASATFTVQQYGGSDQQQQQYQEQFHKTESEQTMCLNQQQMTNETGCPVVSSTSAHEHNSDNVELREAGNTVRQHDNIGSIITMLIADQVRKVDSIPLLLVSQSLGFVPL